MNTEIYTNYGEEVPLGVECALPCRRAACVQNDAFVGSDAFPSKEIENFAAWLLMIPAARTVSD